MYDSIAVLGSTGSVGTQTLEVAELLGLRVDALAADSNDVLLEQQVRKFKPRICAMNNADAAKRLSIALADTDIKVYSGSDGVAALASETKAACVCSSVSGVAGLIPTLAAIESGHDIALSNKETLVTAGAIVMKAARDKGVRILPVDSEHSAIFQCLSSKPKKLILTCSGGPFFGYTRNQLEGVTVEKALAHPTWKMGRKITIDCATLMNKGFEVIEASWLFDIPASSVDVVVHRESIVHSMVMYPDNSVIAQMSVPDMRLCIQYALTYPERTASLTPELDLTAIGALSFKKPDTSVFSPLAAAYEAAERGGIIPAVLNAANEQAVGHFLSGKISFGGLLDVINEAAYNYNNMSDVSLDDIICADKEARNFTDRFFGL